MDIGHDGNYSFKNGDVVRLNIYSRDCIDIVCDGETYPFPVETFDKIMLRCILEHVKEPLKILNECKRILKPNGKIVIEGPFVNPIHAQLLMIIFVLPQWFSGNSKVVKF